MLEAALKRACAACSTVGASIAMFSPECRGWNDLSSVNQLSVSSVHRRRYSHCLARAPAPASSAVDPDGLELLLDVLDKAEAAEAEAG